MTAYWVTIALVGYLMWMAKLSEPAMNERQMGTLPTKPLARILVLSAALVLMIVAALRWKVGTDYGQYVINYDSYKLSFFSDLRTFNEPGIRGIAWLVSQVADNSTVFMAAVSLLTLGLMLFTITRYSIALPMSYLLFIFVGAWHGSFNGVRQFLAAAIILAGHRTIIDRKPIRFLLVVGVASAFHISALAMLPLYLLPNSRLRPAMLVLLAGISLILLYSSDVALDVAGLVKGESAITTEYATNTINPLRILVAALPVLLYFTKSQVTEKDGEWFYRNIIIVNAVVLIAASFSTYLGRFGIYTTVFLPLALPRLIDFPDRQVTALVRGAALVLFSVYWYVDVSGSSSLNQFHFIFDKAISSGT